MEAAELATNCKFSMKLGGVPVLLSPLEESGARLDTYRCTKSFLSMSVVLNSPSTFSLN